MNTFGTHKRPGNPQLQEVVAACGKTFIAVAAFGLCINLLMLTAPLFMLQVFDRVITSRNTDTLVMLMIVAVVALLTLALLEAVRSFTLVRISNWLDRRLGGITLSGSIVATINSGKDPSVQALRDLTTFRTFLSGPSIFPIMDAPFAPIFLAVMFMLHPILGVIALIGAIVLFSLAVVNELATRQLLMQAGGRSIAAMNQAEAAARNADVIEAMGMMPQLIKRWHAGNAEALSLQAQASDRSGLVSSITKFLRMCLQIAVMSAGAWLVIKGEMTPGSMIAGSIIMGRALAPVEQAIGTWKSLLSARAAYGRLKAHLNATPARGEAMPLPAPEGKVEVEGVAYVHGQASDPIFKGVSFALKPGETLGLIGPTAAGKTTLAKLLVGNFVPRAGTVRLDAMDVFAWQADDRGKHIGYLPQDVELFSGTIKDNIARMGQGDPEAVVTAAKRAGVHEMVLRMENGYDTEIGTGGTALSGGQRQRIALARALFGEPRFLVFDEPNANLDSAGEEALLNAIKTLKEERRTVVIIAHRPNLLLHVDKVLILRGGGVAAFGPRDEVLEKLRGAEDANSLPPGGPPVIDASPALPTDKTQSNGIAPIERTGPMGAATNTNQTPSTDIRTKSSGTAKPDPMAKASPHPGFKPSMHFQSKSSRSPAVNKSSGQSAKPTTATEPDKPAGAYRRPLMITNIEKNRADKQADATASARLQGDPGREIKQPSQMAGKAAKKRNKVQSAPNKNPKKKPKKPTKPKVSGVKTPSPPGKPTAPKATAKKNKLKTVARSPAKKKTLRKTDGTAKEAT